MKYIKLFEDISQDGYEEVGHVGYGYSQQHSIDMSRNNINTISSLLSQNNIVYSIESSKTSTESYIAIEDSTKGKYGTGYIVECRDEWFFAAIGIKYYKCDQLDGLLNLLKNIYELK